MSEPLFPKLIDGLKSGQVIPYIGPHALKGSVNKETGAPIPADSDSLILAMNNGQPMAPKLMYEFPRAAMNQELKKGRSFVTRFLTELYGNDTWSRAPLHDWLAELKPKYVIDINRDTMLQASYSDTPHYLLVGLARIGGTDYRFKIFHYDGSSYNEVDQDAVDPALPILFKPMGSPIPEPHYIASDADYVDYITELMGGFGVPAFLKEYRKEKQYLFMGMRFNRDTERMVMSDIVYGAAEPKGWALIPEPTRKEVRFCGKMGIEIIEADLNALLSAADWPVIEDKVAAAQVGC
jgi:hypothetical protein